MKIRSIRQARGLAGKRILLRADFNVPIKNGKIIDDYRIVSGLATIRFLLRYKCKLIIATHLGQPQSQDKAQYTTRPIAERLEKILHAKVKFINDIIGTPVEHAVEHMQPGEIIFLENLRFNEGEEKNDLSFAKNLARLADVYVNDAFAVCHRNHASVSAIKKFIPAYAGLLLASELEHLHKIARPQKPLVAIFGGAKISTKIRLIKNISKVADNILIGGAMASNFIAAQGLEIGKSLSDPEDIALAGKIYDQKKMILPVDVVVNTKKNGEGNSAVKSINKISKSDYIFDIGPETIRLFAHLIKKASTIIWNGPLGMFENPKFKNGTLFIARVVASRSRGQAFGLVGGGETIEALKMTEMEDYIDWVSTAGGAMLAYLGGEKMPGLDGLIE